MGRRWLGLGLVGALLALASGRPARAEAPAVLHLRNGGYVAGSLAPSRQPERVRWQPTLFTEPFEFAAGAINAIHFPVPSRLPRPAGDYCFELAGGDVVFGSLLALEGGHARLEIPRLGALRIDRGVIRRIYRWTNSADLIYLGPNGLSGWREAAGRTAWKEEQGQPWTDQDGSQIQADLGLPPRASIEFEVSWRNKPDFVFALGVGGDEKSHQRAFRFEVWEHDVIIQRETEQEADVASVGEIAPGPGRVHLVAYLDQEKGRILVFSAEGKPLADLKVGAGQPLPQGGLSLSNKRGDLRLERLRISRWNGEPPRQAQSGQSRIHRADGSIVYGTVERYDPGRKAFVLRDAGGASAIPESQLAAIYLPAAEPAKLRSLAVVYQDGTRISGELQAVGAASLTLRVPGIENPLSLPATELRSLVAIGPAVEPAALPGQPGVIELDGARLAGCLVDSPEGSGSARLVWHPQGSLTASPLAERASGRIVYREPAPPKPQPRPATRRPPPPQGQGAAGFVAGFLSALGGNQPAAGGGRRKSLYLRTGDVIPSEIVSIDEKGVTFRTALSASTFVPHDKVQAAEIAHATEPLIRVTRTKRDRLLTLPRMQKENPPTHLVRARNGDYLRGRLLRLDERSLQIEIRLEPRSIPRDRVATIVWLHPQQPGEDQFQPSGADATASAGVRVQSVCHDGIRLTFLAERVSGGALLGKSDVLGPCRVALKDVDQLLIGGGIEKAAAQMVYQQWKLQDAPEPRAAKAGAGEQPDGPASGTESLLVGKPAPDFELDLLDGKKFRLAAARGKPVILDFWATWCGPCLQAMPQVEQVAREFQDRGVRLIAVNLQEDPGQITAMLQRHKLRPTVALDRDGAVAEKYAATAIPQTVVIDREGKIARLFVGGGPHLAEQLREAVRSVLPDGPSRPAAPAPAAPRS